MTHNKLHSIRSQDSQETGIVFPQKLTDNCLIISLRTISQIQHSTVKAENIIYGLTILHSNGHNASGYSEMRLTDVRSELAMVEAMTKRERNKDKKI